MKIALIGGSFNPLHIGHAMLADSLVQELSYDKVLFVPTFLPPHKEITAKISAADRLAMVKAFCDASKDHVFECEPCEIERGGVSYTVDTLEYITEKYKNQLTQKPGFVMGQEIASEFNKWKNPEKIAQLADLIIVPRKCDYDALQKKNCGNHPTGRYKGDFSQEFDKSTFAFPCTFLEDSLIPVSSTQIRARVASGKSYRYLVPKEIFEYIESHKLYK